MVSLHLRLGLILHECSL